MGWDVPTKSVIRENPDFQGSDVWVQDRTALIKVISERHDFHDQDLANAISACLNLDGINSMRADLDMGGFKIINTNVGTDPTDLATVQQLLDTMDFNDSTRVLTITSPSGTNLQAVIPSGSGGGGEGSVTSITIGDGLVGSPNPITVSGEIGLETLGAGQTFSGGVASITVDAHGRVTQVLTGGFSNTNLTNSQTSTTVTVNSSTGTSTTIPQATSSKAGVMSASDKVNMNNLLTLDITGTYYTSYVELELDPLGSVFPLEYARSGRAGVLSGTDWDQFDDAASNNMDDWEVFQPPVNIGGGVFFTDNRGGQSPSIPKCSPIEDGLMSGADKTKLDGLSAVVVAFAADLQGRGIITPAEEADLLAAFA